ncbi:MAG: serine hydrolase [Capsulimonadaceae bacterium]|nr:serine hydrolase [Capsulimonadaceae bacterium]
MPAAPLARCAPEAQSVSSQSILSFIESVEAKGFDIHGMMLLRHGHVVAEGWWEPYDAKTAHMMFSLTKSFTSTAVGLAVSEGRLSLDDHVTSFFMDRLPASPDPRLAALTVRHLLTMTTGQAQDILGPETSRNFDWVRDALAVPFAHDPGTVFAYSSMASHLAGAIVQRLTGQSLHEYLQQRLFGPLGIAKVRWEECAPGVSIGGWGLSLRTEDIARFGQLYLQRGIWNGRRLISEEWIDQATSFQTPNGDDPQSDWNQGYGFQFWRCRHNIYRGDGAFGQFCIVMPEQDAVLAITSGVADMQGVLNEVWEHLLPGMSATPLAEDPRAADMLRARLAKLEASYPIGRPTSPTAALVNGKTYLMSGHPEAPARIRYDFNHTGGVRAALEGCGYEDQVMAGGDQWTESGFDVFIGVAGRVLARGAWVDESTYHARLRLVDTPFTFDTTVRFDNEGSVAVSTSRNVWFGPTELATVTGKWEES